MKTRSILGLAVAYALVGSVLAPGAAQAGLIEATATLTALGNTSPITSNIVIFTGTKTVTGGVEFLGTISPPGGGSAEWQLDLTATGFTIRTNCTGFDDAPGNSCTYPNGLTLSLTNPSFSPLATLTGLTILTVSPDPEDPLLVAGSPQVTASSVIINFQAYDKPSGDPNQNRETVFAAEFQTQPVVTATTPMPGALVLVALGGLGMAALAIRRSRA